MKAPDFKRLWGLTKSFLIKNGPGIAVGTGIGLMGVTVVLVAKEAPVAERELKKAQDEKDEAICRETGVVGPDSCELTVVEKLKVAGPIYIPAAISFASGTALIILGQWKSLNREAAMTAAYTALLQTHEDYVAGVKKIAGKNKENRAEEESGIVTAERIEKEHPDISLDKVYRAPGSTGTTLCLDAWSGQLFYASKQRIDDAVNSINRILNKSIGGYADLNDFYDYAGALGGTDMGHSLGWNGDTGELRCSFSSTLMYDTPCLVIRFDTPPRPEYQFYGR